MTPVTSFAQRKVLVFGLGGSGLATARALVAGGATVAAADDNDARRLAAVECGIAVEDFRALDFAGYDALVLSPGVPLTHPAPHWTVLKAASAGVPVIGDIGLFVFERAHMAPRAPFVAITGTNGKSTTTALIAHILETDGRDVALGGNIGTAVLSLPPPSLQRVHVVEVSSFQIDLAPVLNPSVAVHLNLTEDHLDRHGTMENYAAVKERLVQGADVSVIGVDDSWSEAMYQRRMAAGQASVPVSCLRTVRGGLWAVGQRIIDSSSGLQTVIVDLHGHPVLRGIHNAQNTAAAIGAVRALGVGLEAVREGIATFPGLPHRLEPVGRLDKVLFVNDSKATNADAAARALASFGRIYWIAGGKPKTGGIGPLEGFFPRIAKAYLIGQAAEDFAATLKAAGVPHEVAGTLDVAVASAARDAVRDAAGEPAVVLSPACASFDQFANFEARGDAFRQFVAALPGIIAGPGQA